MSDQEQARGAARGTDKSRLSKRLGDFGEGLVLYALAGSGWYVSYVDDKGADLIAYRDGRRVAISVKLRVFREGSKESRVFVFDHSHLENLTDYAGLFDLEPCVALAVSLKDDGGIHLIVLSLERLRACCKETARGYSVNFAPNKLPDLLAQPGVFYQRWLEAPASGEF